MDQKVSSDSFIRHPVIHLWDEHEFCDSLIRRIFIPNNPPKNQMRFNYQADSLIIRFINQIISVITVRNPLNFGTMSEISTKNFPTNPFCPNLRCPNKNKLSVFFEVHEKVKFNIFKGGPPEACKVFGQDAEKGLSL